MTQKILLATATGLLLTGLGGMTDPVEAATFTTLIDQPLSDANSTYITVQLPQYTPQSGQQLLGVTLDFEASMAGEIAIRPVLGKHQALLVNLTGLLSLTGPENRLLFLEVPTASETYRVPAADRLDTPPVSFSLTARVPQAGSNPLSLSFAVTEPFVVDHFIGNNTVGFTFSVTDLSTIAGAVASSQVDKTVSAQLGITYTTAPLENPPTALPEPTVILGMACLPGLYRLLGQPMSIRNQKVR